MAGLSTPISEICTQLETLTVVNSDGYTVKPLVRLWNNQLPHIKDGTTYAHPLPAIFLEVLTDIEYKTLGEGFKNSDLGIKIHLIFESYHNNTSWEQDLTVYDLRDQIIQSLTFFKPTSCGGMLFVSESPDFDHDNLYHYTIDFICNFTDSKGSVYDLGLQYEDVEHPENDLVQQYIIKK